MTAPNQRTNFTPTMSATMLAKYLTATPQARQTTLKNAKYPPDVLALRYQPAKAAARKYLLSGCKQNVIDDAIVGQKARLQTANTDWKRDDARQSASVTSMLPAVCQKIPGTFQKFPSAPKLNINNVDVSVTTEVLILQGNQCGGTLFTFSQTINQPIMECIATLIYMRLSGMGLNTPVAQSLCVAVNVRNQTVISAAQSNPSLTNQCAAACSHITQVWGQI